MTFFKATTLAATTLAIALGAAAPASALSIELAPGVELKQDCRDETRIVTKMVHVQVGTLMVSVPKHVEVTETVCEDYYTTVSETPPSFEPKPLAYPEFNPDAGTGVNGRSVGIVHFDGGTFEQRGRTWIETGAAGEDRFFFEETGRDEWSVYLFDHSRNVSLQLDLHRDLILYEGSPLYPITSVAR